MSDHRIASMSIGAGSVQITADTSRSATTYTDQYELVEEDSTSLYHYLYVHSVKHGGILLMVYYLSADKQQCYFFREVNIYPTLADCKKANVPLDPQKEEFETWYAPAVFKTYSAYSALADADSATVKQVSSDFVGKVMEHAASFRVTNSERSQNPNLPRIYAGNTYQNIISKVLIAHHLNPNATLADLSRRTDQLHKDVPVMPRHP